MNVRAYTLIFVFACCAALSARAAEAPAHPGIAIDCAHPLLPSQAEVSSLTGVENFGQAYAERTRLMQQALRACQRGAARVVIVRDPQTQMLEQVAHR